MDIYLLVMGIAFLCFRTVINITLSSKLHIVDGESKLVASKKILVGL